MGGILVVDDDSDIRETMAFVLADEGYTVYEATDGANALEVLSTLPESPCLVLLDIMMPRMNGLEFLTAVEGLRQLDALPIVIVSAHASAEHRRARRTLSKPVRLEALLGVVKEACIAHLEHRA